MISRRWIRRVTEVSYLGFVHGTTAALARMRPRDRGVIVQVGHDKSGVSITVVQMLAVNTPQFSWVRSKLSPTGGRDRRRGGHGRGWRCAGQPGPPAAADGAAD